MLSPRETELLRYFKDHGRASRADVLNAFDPQKRATETDALLRNLCKLGLVSFSHPLGTYGITDAGVSALLVEADVSRQRAKDEHHNALQDKLGIAQVLITLFSFLLGLWVEYATEIIETVLRLFS